MDTVVWLLPTLLYLVGYALTFRRIAGQLAWHSYAHQMREYRCLYEGKPCPGGEQWFGAIVASSVLSVAWPISLPVAHALARARFGTGFFYIPPSERGRLREDRIRELEKAAGLR